MNNQELDVLYGKPAFLFKLYFFGIRRYMDYATGIVGIKRRISYQSLREAMYVESEKGITCIASHKAKIQRALKALIKLGLLKQIPDQKHIVFKCLLATRDESVQNIPDTDAIRVGDTVADTNNVAKLPVKLRVVAESKNKPDTLPDTPESAIPDTPPLSVNKKPIINTYVHFDEFWSEYPRKEGGREKIKEQWAKKNLDKIAKEIIDDVRERKAKHIGWQGEKRYIPYPSTYLNKRLWQDDILTAEANGHKAHQSYARPLSKADIFERSYQQDSGRIYDAEYAD